MEEMLPDAGVWLGERGSAQPSDQQSAAEQSPEPSGRGSGAGGTLPAEGGGGLELRDVGDRARV